MKYSPDSAWSTPDATAEHDAERFSRGPWPHVCKCRISRGMKVFLRFSWELARAAKHIDTISNAILAKSHHWLLAHRNEEGCNVRIRGNGLTG
jgi:hypothetical protein